LTGLTLAAFGTLLADFERAYEDDRRQRDRQRPTPRQRRPGGGAKGALPTAADKLVFLLFYFRQYPHPGDLGVPLRLQSRTSLPEDIINLAFGLTLGALAVAVAIAFGFGGREIAQQILA
jgi:hypothetical protein